MDITLNNLNNMTKTKIGVSAVGTASTLILAANDTRAYALIINDSDTKMYLNFGAAAVLGQGIPLMPSASYEISPANANHHFMAVFGISSVADKSASYLEGV